MKQNNILESTSNGTIQAEKLYIQWKVMWHKHSLLLELEHIFQKKHHYGPSNTTPPVYGTKVQYVEEDLTRRLTIEQYKQVKKIVGKFLYYGRAINNTMAHIYHESHWITKE